MIGEAFKRPDLLRDPLLRKMMEDRGLTALPLISNQSETRRRLRAAISEIEGSREGPTASRRREVNDLHAMAREVKARARAAGADLVGMCALQPWMIAQGVDCPYENVVAIAHHEAYEKVLEGPDAVSDEAHRAYYMVAKIAAELTQWIRGELAWPALFHLSEGAYILALPVAWQCGLGELGKHGSLIHPEFGANFRLSFITTNLPVAHDSPISFGVQDQCMTCQACVKNCPGDAIPNEHVETLGISRWLTDVEKCYPYSRLRAEYCHICVDVCPYNAPLHRNTYKTLMMSRKESGYKEPKWRGSMPATRDKG